MIVAQTRDECAALQVHLIGSGAGECPYLVVVTDGDEPAASDGYSLSDGRLPIERDDVRVVENPIRDGTGSWTTATDKGGYEKEAHQVSHIWHGANMWLVRRANKPRPLARLRTPRYDHLLPDIT